MLGLHTIARFARKDGANVKSTLACNIVGDCALIPVKSLCDQGDLRVPQRRPTPFSSAPERPIPGSAPEIHPSPRTPRQCEASGQCGCASFNP
jgi:hypothetical protein